MRLTPKRVDYAKIAPNYDKTRERTEIPADLLLGERLRAESRLRLLDVGCGTGAYLLAQARAYPDVDLFGIDPSAEMLAFARTKVESAHLTKGRAEALPYESGFFDFIISRFSFHYFENKPLALDEICRVMTPQGVFVMENIAQERMPGWWIYRAFPESVPEDARRFWSVERIGAELQKRGLDWTTTFHRIATPLPVEEALVLTKRREISQFFTIEESAYQRGLERLERMFAENPTATLPSGVVLVRGISRRIQTI